MGSESTITNRYATVLLIISIVLSSLVGVVLTLHHGWTWDAILATRGAFAVIGLAVWMFITRSPIDVSNATLFGGIAWGLTFTLFISATVGCNDSKITMALEAGSPLFAIGLGWTSLGERPHRRDFGAVLVFSLGLTAIVLPAIGIGGDTDSKAARGQYVLFGVLESVMYAAAIVTSRWIERRGAHPGESRSALLIGNVLAFFIGLFSMLIHGVSFPDKETIGLCAFLGLFQVALAFGLLSKSLSALPSWVASIGLGAGMTLNIIWLAIRYGKWPDPGEFQFWGSCLIAIASAWLTCTRFRHGEFEITPAPRAASTRRSIRIYLRRPLEVPKASSTAH